MTKVVIGNCTLIHGDCLEVLPTLEAGSVDAVVTDPPYGIGIAGNPFRQKHDVKEWDDVTPSPSTIQKLISIAPVAIIWGGNYFDLPPTQRFLIWDKVQPEEFSSSMVEMAWTNLSGPAKLFQRHVVSYQKYHPTTKPLELMLWCMKFIPTADAILDPFMGSGTTGVACVKTNRKFIGIEKEKAYFDIACKRIRAAYDETALFDAAPVEEQSMLIGGGK